LTQATETGAVYSAAEIGTLADLQDVAGKTPL